MNSGVRLVIQAVKEIVFDTVSVWWQKNKYWFDALLVLVLVVAFSWGVGYFFTKIPFGEAVSTAFGVLYFVTMAIALLYFVFREVKTSIADRMKIIRDRENSK